MPSRIALPRSPTSASPTGRNSPSWHRDGTSIPHSRRQPYAQSRSTAMRDRVINTVERLRRRFLAIWRSMSPLQRTGAVVVGLTVNTLGILFLVYHDRVFDWLSPFAEKWKKTTGGWVILWAMTFLTAFPPLIGYSTCGMLAGLVYGVGEGWLIYASATVAGSFCSFIVSRTVLRSYVERMVASDKRFAALTLTLKEDGLKLLCMIRLCPLPYSISNGAMSTFPTVQPAMYALATAIVSPKLLVHVFIGSRIRAIAGSESSDSKIVNWVSIIAGGIIGAVTGFVIYRKTMARAQELEAEEARAVQDSSRRTGAPPPQFSDDPETHTAAATLAADDDQMTYFDDDADPQRYHDEASGADDAFGKGDGDEEETIGLHSKPDS